MTTSFKHLHIHTHTYIHTVCGYVASTPKPRAEEGAQWVCPKRSDGHCDCHSTYYCKQVSIQKKAVNILHDQKLGDGLGTRLGYSAP